MNSIYTSKNSLVVEKVIWSGVCRYVKHMDGTYENFYRANTETKFTKTGWGKRAARDFQIAFNSVKAELDH